MCVRIDVCMDRRVYGLDWSSTSPFYFFYSRSAAASLCNNALGFSFDLILQGLACSSLPSIDDLCRIVSGAMAYYWIEINA
mmetsp:Transcript_3668/g.7896  ORF Transcript_3668/g.7896 Transcript_3668/m.7896 type:complete len:81 (+) Transcript_3668:1659-1901(+)